MSMLGFQRPRRPLKWWEGIILGLTQGAKDYLSLEDARRQRDLQQKREDAQLQMQRESHDWARDEHNVRMDAGRETRRLQSLAPAVQEVDQAQGLYPEAFGALTQRKTDLLSGKVQPGQFDQSGVRFDITSPEPAQKPAPPPLDSLRADLGGIDAIRPPNAPAAPRTMADLLKAGALGPAPSFGFQGSRQNPVKQALGAALDSSLGTTVDVPATVSSPLSGINLGRRVDEIRTEKDAAAAARRSRASIVGQLVRGYLQDRSLLTREGDRLYSTLLSQRGIAATKRDEALLTGMFQVATPSNREERHGPFYRQVC